ncbi:hypothetical protein E2C01_078499 [Portunus trituberculatus]|uniref:Uncharacterized protein n=1 Tax=Portunus trituberculatus TaxID=210409 RepID=A0A5B7IMQ6_PORTR|nr:hypothetical protein [Portunus trituberculatus]
MLSTTQRNESNGPHDIKNGFSSYALLDEGVTPVSADNAGGESICHFKMTLFCAHVHCEAFFSRGESLTHDLQHPVMRRVMARDR